MHPNCMRESNLTLDHGTDLRKTLQTAVVDGDTSHTSIPVQSSCLVSESMKLL